MTEHVFKLWEQPSPPPPVFSPTMGRPIEIKERQQHYRSNRCTSCWGRRNQQSGTLVGTVLVVVCDELRNRRELQVCKCRTAMRPELKGGSLLRSVGGKQGKHGKRGRTPPGQLSRPWGTGRRRSREREKPTVGATADQAS